VVENGNLEELKEKIELLTNEFHIMSTKLYEEAQAAGSAAHEDVHEASYGEEPGVEADNVVDADFEVVDDEKDEE